MGKSVGNIVWDMFVDIIEFVVVGFAIFLIVYSFISSPHVIYGDSMEPNFTPNEFVLTDKISYRLHNPQRGDVIVFQYDPTREFIKRIIGLPGDKVEINNGKVYVNGKVLNESAYEAQQTEGEVFMPNGTVKTVPQNEYFVLGDNRAVSDDSRYFGFISKDSIQGRVFFKYWPLQDVGLVPQVKYSS